MPNFHPFKATRYADTEHLPDVTAPPYDVISPSSRESLAKDPHNFVHVSLPLPTREPESYENAARTLRAWIADSVLVREEQESMFLYASDFMHDGMHHTTTGLIGALGLEPFGEGSIFPHERTNPGPKADRLSLMRTTDSNLEPLWFFAAEPIPSYSDVSSDARSTPPMMDVSSDGVRHRVWKVAPSAAATVTAEISKIPLVVADGHHRYETAISYRDERRAIDGDGPWDSTLALIMDTQVDPPTVLPIHRLIEGTSAQDLAHSLGDPTPSDQSLGSLTAQVAAHGPGMVGVSGPDGTWTVTMDARLDTIAVADAVERLQAAVTYEHSVLELSVHIQRGQVAVVLAPVDLRTVASMALAGERMPPKTTLFWPKPLSGLLFRDFSA